MNPNFLGLPQLAATFPDPELINATTKTRGTIITTNGYGSEISDQGLYSQKIDFKIAGNSSALSDEKSYNVTTLTSANANNDVPWLDLAPGRDWRLYAGAFDPSKLNNHFAFRLARQLSNIPWVSKTIPVELTINSVYQGIYLLIERIKKHNNRVRAGGTGALLMEITLDNQIAAGDPFFTTTLLQAFTSPQFDAGLPSSYVPDVPAGYSSLSQPEKDALTAEMDALDDAIVAHDWESVWEFFDMNAIVDWYVFQEFIKNWDSPRLGSIRLIRDSVVLGGKAWLGVWDHDISIGLSFEPFDNLDDWAPPEGLWAGQGTWFAHIIQDTAFMDAVKARFVQLLPMLYREISILEANAAFLDSSGAYDRDFAKWGMLPFVTAPCIYDSHQEAAAGAIAWIKDRIAWLRTQWETPAVITPKSFTITTA